jgi:hypothetical protein
VYMFLYPSQGYYIRFFPGCICFFTTLGVYMFLLPGVYMFLYPPPPEFVFVPPVGWRAALRPAPPEG